MIRSGTAAMAAFASLLSAAPAAAQPGMGMLGQRLVSDAVDHDTIAVNKTELYATLMVCVDDAPVHFMEMVVRYKNGASQNIRLRSVIQAGRCGREIELHNRRDIAGVDFTYEAASLRGGRATIQLFGR